MTHLEENLRAAVEDLAASAPRLNNLAMVARIRGRRIRRRRQAVLGAAMLVLAGAVITPYAVLNGHRAGPRPQPVASVPPSTSAVVPAPSQDVTVPAVRKDWWKAPIELPGGVVVTSVGRRAAQDENGDDLPVPETMQAGNVALDRATGRYRIFPSGYQLFQAAPTGKYVLVEDGLTARVGIVNSATGGSRKLSHGSGSGAMQWTPDGKKLLLPLNAGGIRLIDATNAAEKDVEIPNANAFCPDFCFFTWLPGGKEVAIAQRDPDVERSEATLSTVKTVDVYSATTGKLLRTLPIPGFPVGSAAWSPDGRHVVLLPDANGSGLRIAEVATGRVVGVIPDISFDYPTVTSQVRFIGNDQVLALDGLDAGVYDLTGKLRATSRLPADLAGRTVTLGNR
jgi:hypothetical protein